jgi:predicted phosphodiesterase
MRLAVLGDIHGNLAALGAVLKHARHLGVDGFVVVGDIVVGAPTRTGVGSVSKR